MSKSIFTSPQSNKNSLNIIKSHIEKFFQSQKHVTSYELQNEREIVCNTGILCNSMQQLTAGLVETFFYSVISCPTGRHMKLPDNNSSNNQPNKRRSK